MRYISGSIICLLILISCDSNDPNPGEQTTLNGCQFSTAIDMAGQASVNINNTSPWSVNHAACIIVDQGTIVTWEGNFDLHPLIGGITPTKDSNSPISLAPSESGSSPVQVTFSDMGDYPYFCNFHLSNMQGVVYVR